MAGSQFSSFWLWHFIARDSDTASAIGRPGDAMVRGWPIQENDLSGFPSVDILGVRVHELSKDDLLAQAARWCEQSQPRIITYANAHCINLAQELPHYRAALNASDLVYSDGIGVVWAARWLTATRLEKITGRNWIADLCNLAVERHLRLYLLGGQLGVAAQAGEKLRTRFPGLDIAAARDGFFTGTSETDVLAEISEMRPHLVLVGMGTPRQELWLAANRAQVKAPVCWAVGALFDLVADIEPAVPPWMNNLGLEWLWRMLADPRGKWRRYLFGNPLFLLRVARKRFGV
jgi:N-acetylglucosaminyldiphosphoundecaprenol N-acetyl-beta-D-mannosaminyltransferase